MSDKKARPDVDITGDGNVVGDHSSSTVIKDNVFQVIIRKVAPIAGFAVLAAGIVVGLGLAAGVFNLETLVGFLPTPMPFEPAGEGESLIIVADFEDRSGGKYQGVDPAQYIYEKLVEQARADDLDVRIERLRQVVDDNTVHTTGEVYSATLVLWGWYDAAGITPRLERIQEMMAYRSSEEMSLALAEPETVEFKQIILEDLPVRSSYLVLFVLGMGEYVKRDTDGAFAYFNSALAVTEGNEESTNPSETYFYRGNLHYYRGDYGTAVVDFTRAISLTEFVEAYSNRGVSYNDMGEYELALADYNQALELNPESAEAYNNRGVNYNDKGEYELALADYNRALELNPEYAGAYYNRGLNCLAMEDDNCVIASFSGFIQLRPDPTSDYYAGALFLRAGAYVRQGDWESAIADYTKLIQIRPDFATAY
jgi:tetratricopeptide (TPR) repeat protein